MVRAPEMYVSGIAIMQANYIRFPVEINLDQILGDLLRRQIVKNPLVTEEKPDQNGNWADTIIRNSRLVWSEIANGCSRQVNGFIWLQKVTN